MLIVFFIIAIYQKWSNNKGYFTLYSTTNDNNKPNNKLENDVTHKIKQLYELKELGLITEDEYNKRKQELLDNI